MDSMDRLQVGGPFMPLSSWLTATVASRLQRVGTLQYTSVDESLSLFSARNGWKNKKNFRGSGRNRGGLQQGRRI